MSIDKERLREALASLPETHPLVVQLGEAKCGLHVIKQALAHQNMHIANIENKIIEEYDNKYSDKRAASVSIHWSHDSDRGAAEEGKKPYTQG